MTLDLEEDRAILLYVMEQASFPGKFAETVARVKQSIREADVAEAVDEQPAAP